MTAAERAARPQALRRALARDLFVVGPYARAAGAL